jgi:hypothetical protein
MKGGVNNLIQFSNPFVAYLNRYSTVTSEHEAAFDEFVTKAKPPSGDVLRLKTKTEEFVGNHFKQAHPASIILTGNAGDGKTYLCRQIVRAFTGEPLDSWGDNPELSIPKGAQMLRVVKDLSEVSSEKGSALLRNLAAAINDESIATVFLIAANEGRLRDLLTREGLGELYQIVDHQLLHGPDLENSRLIVLNLNEVTTSTYVIPTLEWITNSEHWKACEGCIAFDDCPIRFNAIRLKDLHISSQLQLLYQLLEHVGIHVTIRDMLIHLSYTLSRGKTCEEIIAKSSQPGKDMHKDAYYENILGNEMDYSFQNFAVINYLRSLTIGDHSQFEIDDFIINGHHENPQAQEEYERLFSPAVDLENSRFAIDRDGYLQGGAASPQREVDHFFIQHWLPHCRRKLFFEWKEREKAIRLIPFTFFAQYLRLLEGNRGLQEHTKRALIKGLNRAFSKLYISDEDNLHVTSQYARTVEQPMPIVQLSLPADNIELALRSRLDSAYDYDKQDLFLRISPPSQMENRSPIEWSIDLLQFEYLMRLAQGGTYNILAQECELVVRQLKDELLTKFAARMKKNGYVRFFVGENNRYILRKLWIDEEGKKIQVGVD